VVITRLTIACSALLLSIVSAAVAGHASSREGTFAADAAAAPPAVMKPRALESGVPVETVLAPRQEHTYLIPLLAAQVARLTIEQRGIDLIVEVRDAADATLAEFNDEVQPKGVERVDVVAAAPGTYTVAIRPARGTVAPGRYAVNVEELRAATDADRLLQEAHALRTSAAQSEAVGRFADARSSLERALILTEGIRGRDDIQVGRLALQLAGVNRKLADGPDAEAMYLRAIAIIERTLGIDHPNTALAQSQLAVLYQRAGERRKAESLLNRAFSVFEKTIGSEHPWFVSALITLASLRDSAGDLDAEETLLRRGLSITEKIGDTESLQYAALLNNLGEVQRQRQDYAGAEQLFRRSFDLGTRLLGPENYSIATSLQNLAIVARERKDYTTAIEYNVRALAIRQRMVGSDHPDVAHILTNLANIYRATGDYDKALETHHRALHIWEHAAGSYQRATLLSVGNIAKTYAAIGDTANAIAYQRRTDAIVEKQLALNLAVGSERQKLLFVRGMSERTDRTISLHLREAPDSSEAGELAALAVLQRKGRVLDAMIDTFAAVRRRLLTAGDRALLDSLNVTTTDLARIALDGSPTAGAQQRHRAVVDLEEKKETLEEALAEHSAAFRAQLQPVTLAAVRTAVPVESALLEFTIFRPFDPKAERNSEAYAPPHYAAYIVTRQNRPRGMDLGPSDAIDAAVDALRQALRDPDRSDVAARARVVDDLVMRPLRASVGGARRLLISADGELNLIPFEALMDEAGHYLIERYSMTYLTSGRDLLRMQTSRASRRPPVIFADPVFGEPRLTSARQPVVDMPATAPINRSSTSAAPRSTAYFAPLAATAEEAHAIKELFPDASLFTGSRATKEALLHVDAPRMLHIASHGFFLEDGQLALDNPLLRSGLAMAGANLSRRTRDDGMLTALEASGINLWGTRLVTLSACDTGVGEVRNGEGVYGLRRAFVLAGAETVVMSLWPVSDAIARETMVSYYKGLRAGRGRGDALRESKLAMLKRPGRQHPFYWASFIQSGEWANLDGRR
jgi:CHAT domain-containing protein/Tfp pilus assembly protein PilF